MGETHSMVVETRTDRLDIRSYTCTGHATQGLNVSSVPAQFDHTLQSETIQTVNTAHKTTNFDNSETAFADSENGEQREPLYKVALHSTSVMSSAGLYLLDLISSVCVLKVYWEEVYIHGQFEGSIPGSIGTEITAFATCLGFLLASQIVAMVVFKLNLPPGEYPLRSACLLPLVQAYRLLKELCRWKTGNWRHVRSSKRWEASASLFSIMSAMETSLQLPLQVTYIVLTGLRDRRWRPPPVLVLSVVASFLSGGYNAGLAIMYNASLNWGVMLNATGIAGGMYTVGAMLLRCMAVVQVGIASDVSGVEHRKLLSGYYALWSPLFYCFGLISLGRTAKLFTCNSQLRAGLTTFYFVLGPMYPVLEGFAPKVKSISLKVDTLVRLLVVVHLNVCLDVLIFIVAAGLNWGMCRYSKERFPNSTHLSSTLKCSQFIFLTSIGAVLSLVSTLALCYLLLRSSLQDVTVSVGLEIRKLIRLVPSNDSNGSLREDQKSLRSRRYQPMSDRISMMLPKIMRINLRKFSSRVANVDGTNYEDSRMVSTNPTKTSAECLDVKDVEAFTSDEMTSSYETGEDLYLNVKSQETENAADGFLLPVSSSQELKKTPMDTDEVEKSRTYEPEGGEDDERPVPVEKEHRCNMPTTRRNDRKLGRSTSVRTREKSCASARILTTLSLGSSASFRKLLEETKADEQTRASEKIMLESFRL